jgi:hypothetical protein
VNVGAAQSISNPGQLKIAASDPLASEVSVAGYLAGGKRMSCFVLRDPDDIPLGGSSLSVDPDG